MLKIINKNIEIEYISHNIKKIEIVIRQIYFEEKIVEYYTYF